MRILIIGGNRFVGKLVTKELYTQGHDITVLNRTGTSPVECNILECNRNILKQFEEAIGDKTFDCVIDMCLYNLDQAKISTKVLQHRTHKYIFISSVAAYKQKNIWPIKETNALGGMEGFSNYGVDKALVEEYFKSIPNFPYINLRPTYIIGKENHNYREQYYFDMMIDNKPVDMGPEGDKIVSFVFADDVANIICAFATLDSLIRESYNINGDEHLTIEKFIRVISEVVDKDFTINKTQTPNKFKNVHLIFSNDKVKNRLKYKFKTLTKGLTEFYEYTY
tara:strand:- start:914 stop:1753 length:840 start_codon:yes stop_codon:yes gene_type:complete